MARARQLGPGPCRGMADRVTPRFAKRQPRPGLGPAALGALSGPKVLTGSWVTLPRHPLCIPTPFQFTLFLLIHLDFFMALLPLPGLSLRALPGPAHIQPWLDTARQRGTTPFIIPTTAVFIFYWQPRGALEEPGPEPLTASRRVTNVCGQQRRI